MTTAAGSRSERVEAQLKGLPAQPGVYLFRNGGDEVLYVGKAKSLRSRIRSRPALVKQPQAAPCQECGNSANEAGAASFAIRMQYRGEERPTELPLTQDMIGRLAFEAAFRNVQIGELIGELIVGLLKEDLLQATLAPKETRRR